MLVLVHADLRKYEATMAVFTLKENMEVVRRTFNSENVKVPTKTNKSKVYLFTV